MARRCNKCSHILPDSSDFCPICRMPVTENAEFGNVDFGEIDPDSEMDPMEQEGMWGSSGFGGPGVWDNFDNSSDFQKTDNNAYPTAAEYFGGREYDVSRDVNNSGSSHDSLYDSLLNNKNKNRPYIPETPAESVPPVQAKPAENVVSVQPAKTEPVKKRGISLAVVLLIVSLLVGGASWTMLDPEKQKQELTEQETLIEEAKEMGEALKKFEQEVDKEIALKNGN